MNTILVWLLIATSTGSHNGGNVSLIAKFQSVEQCEHVREQIPKSGYNVQAVCIQARIVN